MANCFYHEEKEAVSRCAVCGKGVCEECTKQANGMNFCSEECKSKATVSTGRSNDVLSEKSRTDSNVLVRKLIYIFVVIAAVAAAWYFYAQNQKTVDSRINRSLNKVQKSTSNLIKDTQKAIPTSSQAKRKSESLVK